MISSIYNITDQIFIGQGIGKLGNAATTVAFPITIICTAIVILFGFGAAASINLEMGKGNKEKVSKIIGTIFTSLLIAGFLISGCIALFMGPLLNFFGATEQNLSYVISYVSIISIGIPFLFISTGGSHLIRADERISCLLDVECKSRWVSIKPFIGEVNIEEYLKTQKIDL